MSILSEAEMLKVKEIAQIVIEENKGEMVCKLHCAERHGKVSMNMLVVFMMSIGAISIAIGKFMFPKILSLLF